MFSNHINVSPTHINLPNRILLNISQNIIRVLLKYYHGESQDIVIAICKMFVRPAAKLLTECS